MSYARIRPELSLTWKQVELKDLEGNELYWTPATEWVKAICFDAQASGLYVLTEDDESYFTCHSADLEYRDELPTKREKPMGKHALPYNYHTDLKEAENAFVEELGQDLDTWQLIARDLAREITRNDHASDDAFSFAYDVLNRLAHMPEMNIHPSEVRPTTTRSY